MAKQTINLGTIPNSGLDGDDARTAFTKVNENFGELYTAMGGTGGTVSPKLTAIANSVWAANQLLMASGPNTLTMLASGATGRSLIAAADALAGRNVLGLGSASLLVATTSTTDVTAGRSLRVGDSGLGAVSAVVISDANLNLPTGMFLLNTAANGGLNGPTMDTFVGAWSIANYSANATSGFQIASPQTGVAANKGRLFSRQVFSGTWSAWVELVTDAALGAIGWGAKGATGSTLVTGTDLNTMKVPGSYGQPANANATLALNYPTNQAGTLLVQAAGANIVTQQYTNYNSGRTWFRSAYNDVWSTWKEMPSIQDYGLGAIRSGEATYYIMLPSTPNNTAATAFIAANPTDDQAVAHQPVAGEEFGGVHVSRQLRPAQFGVSGRGAYAKFFYRGYNSSTSALSEWFQAASVSYVNSLGLGGVGALVTDMNSPAVTGMYRIAASGANLPESGQSCSFWHIQQTAAIASQIALVTASNKVWCRTLNTSWSAWKEVGADVAQNLLAANGIGTNASPLVTDLDLAVTGGSYRFANTAANKPVGASGLVYVASYAATYVAQIVVTVQASDAALYNRMFSRTMNQGAWGPWKEIISETNLPPMTLAVALAGLVTTTNSAVTAADTVLVAMGKLQAQINNIRTIPLTGYAVGANSAVAATDTLLGAIGKLQGQINATTPISKGGTGATTAAGARANLGLGDASLRAVLGDVAAGSALMSIVANGNGIVFRFANGMQVCVLQRAMNATTVNVGANEYYSFLWTFPAQFIGLDYTVNAQFEPINSLDHYGFIHANGWLTSACGLVVRNGAVVQGFIVSAIAVGRWQ